MNIFAVSGMNTDAYPEGWVRYAMEDYTLTATTSLDGVALTYTGAPMTTSVVHFGSADAWGIGCGWAPSVIQVLGINQLGVSTPGVWNVLLNYQAATNGLSGI